MVSKHGKVAICLSGQIRTGIPAYKSFEKFFSDLDADVFFHTWQDLKKEPKVIDLYKPKKYSVQMPFPKDSKTNSDGMGSWGNMLYSMMMANELKKQYEIENDFRYDLVIKSRFDLVFPSHYKFPTESIMPRTIYCSGGNNGINHTDYESHGISDIIFWGDSESMDIATNVFMYYKHIALVANNQFILGHKFDPIDYYYSAGNLIYSRVIKQNIAVVKYVTNVFEVPWREDISHVDPIADYSKIRKRYQQV
jgi:hypothetical protein